MQVTRPPIAAPRFGMTPAQQKEVREKIFVTLYPHLDQSLNTVNTVFNKRPSGQISTYGQFVRTVVQTMAQLATFQEQPRF